MLLDKLTEKGISNTDAEEVADWLCGLGVVNDERFAGLVVRHYAAKGYGKRRICDELYRRGIDRELWDAAFAELPETDDTVDRLLGAKLRGDVSPKAFSARRAIFSAAASPGRRSARRQNAIFPERTRHEPILHGGHDLSRPPENLVNSEEMLALLQDAGYAFTDDLAKADAVIINTCAFIESAKTEAIEKILETASYREEKPGAQDHRLRLSRPTLCRRYPRRAPGG